MELREKDAFFFIIIILNLFIQEDTLKTRYLGIQLTLKKKTQND